jgi:tetratricopeptide (TPR) repeat protein
MYHAKFLISAGRMAWMVDLDAATRLFVRALDVSRDLGDHLQAAWALAFQGYAMQREPEAAMPIAEASLALFREMNHQPGIAQALNIIGELARMGGDDARAKRAYEECLAVCQQTGEALRTCYNLVNLAYVAQHEGEHERALNLVRQALQFTRDTKAHGYCFVSGDIRRVNCCARPAGSSSATARRIGGRA